MTNPTRDLFDDWAKKGRGEGMEEGHFPRAEQALENIPIMPGDCVLDLGCGNGWATRWMRQCVGEDGKAIGVDIAPEMIDLAAKSIGETKGIDFVEGAFECLPFPDDHVDHAFSMEALYYAPEISVALTDIARVIKVGGTLTFCTDFFTENPHCHDWPEKMQIPMALMSEADWCLALETAGFKILETMRCFDSRPADSNASEEEQVAVEDFRQNIGSLSILSQKMA